MRSRRLVLLAAIVCCAAGVVAKQTATGRITGVTTDTSGGVIPGASIQLYLEGRGGRLSQQQSDRFGRFAFEALPSGVYRVDAELKGFDIPRQRAILVTPDTPTPSITLAMPIGAICECVGAGPQTGFATVSGTIVDVDGRPIPRVLLQIRDVQPFGDSAYSGSNGEFTVRLPAGKTHALLVSDPAFNSVTHQIAVSTRNAPVTVRLTARTPAPEQPATQVLKRGCRCGSDLFTHPDR